MNSNQVVGDTSSEQLVNAAQQIDAGVDKGILKIVNATSDGSCAIPM
jgi:hypothetical protein